VHTDSQAASSAQAVDALAYTVGQHIAFAAGQYRPETRDGRRLLIHELAHVVQQDGAVPSPPAPLVIMPSEATQEREADQVADRVLQGERVGPSLSGLAQTQLQRTFKSRGWRQGLPQNAGGSDPVGPPFLCGVDVTDALKKTVNQLPATFSGWSEDEKEDACNALTALTTGGMAWDIIEMHGQVTSDVINRHSGGGRATSFCAPCATPGAVPACGSSVTIDGTCHFAGSANYVIFGKMCQLCRDFADAEYDSHSWLTDTPYRMMQISFSKAGMISLIDFYKKWVPLLMNDFPASNIEAAKRWATAGYDGWPSVGTPTPDRANCGDCSKPSGYKWFNVSWYPKLNPGDR
jgi:hypothetical protein